MAPPLLSQLSDDIQILFSSLWLDVRSLTILLLDTSDLVTVGLKDCINITDQCIESVVNCCLKLRGINIEGCRKVTDAVISALGAGNNQLRITDPYGNIIPSRDERW